MPSHFLERELLLVPGNPMEKMHLPRMQSTDRQHGARQGGQDPRKQGQIHQLPRDAEMVWRHPNPVSPDHLCVRRYILRLTASCRIQEAPAATATGSPEDLAQSAGM